MAGWYVYRWTSRSNVLYGPVKTEARARRIAERLGYGWSAVVDPIRSRDARPLIIPVPQYWLEQSKKVSKRG